MGINQGYLFVFLLASLSASCTSNCPTPDPTSPYDESTYRECAKLYSTLEDTLLENPGNLYKLYNNFFPSSGLEPTYVLVYFYLHKLNDSGQNEYYTSACWTSSIVLKSVAPTVLASLQPNLLSLLLQTVGASELTTELVYGERLFLNFTMSDWYSDITTLDGVVQDFTLLLKVYASTQQRRSFWTAADLKYKGYNCNPTLLWTPAKSLLVSIAVLIVVLTTIALIKAVPKLYQNIASQDHSNQSYSFFWAASFVASLCNTALLLFEILPYHYLNLYSIMESKIAMTVLLLLIDILAAICIPKSTDFPVPHLAYLIFFPFCLCYSIICCVRSRQLQPPDSKFIQTLALTSFFIFAQFIALSVLPTIVWAFVFPIQILAAIAFFAAAIFCVTALIALLLRNIKQLTCSKTYCSRGNWSTTLLLLMQLLLIPILILILFLATVILSFYIYIESTTGIETNQVGGSIASFLPSAILTIIGSFVTKGKVFKQTFPQKSDPTSPRSQANPPTEQTPLINASTNV